MTAIPTRLRVVPQVKMHNHNLGVVSRTTIMCNGRSTKMMLDFLDSLSLFPSSFLSLRLSLPPSLSLSLSARTSKEIPDAPSPHRG